jgi:hypothetical protein
MGDATFLSLVKLPKIPRPYSDGTAVFDDEEDDYVEQTASEGRASFQDIKQHTDSWKLMFQGLSKRIRASEIAGLHELTSDFQRIIDVMTKDSVPSKPGKLRLSSIENIEIFMVTRHTELSKLYSETGDDKYYEMMMDISEMWTEWMRYRFNHIREILVTSSMEMMNGTEDIKTFSSYLKTSNI